VFRLSSHQAVGPVPNETAYITLRILILIDLALVQFTFSQKQPVHISHLYREVCVYENSCYFKMFLSYPYPNRSRSFQVHSVLSHRPPCAWGDNLTHPSPPTDYHTIPAPNILLHSTSVSLDIKSLANPGMLKHIQYIIYLHVYSYDSCFKWAIPSVYDRNFFAKKHLLLELTLWNLQGIKPVYFIHIYILTGCFVTQMEEFGYANNFGIWFSVWMLEYSDTHS
jgi:hypothetical protein